MGIREKAHYLPVHGTGGLNRAEDWWRDGSLFCKMAEENGLTCLDPEDPFFWSGKVDGFSFLSAITLGFFNDPHETWIGDGLQLRKRLRAMQLEDRNLILHSHALQVAAYANYPVNNIISVGSPIRADLSKHYEALRNNCNRWMHIYDRNFDKMAILGQLGDSRWFGSRNNPYAHENVKLADIDHSKILHDPALITLWRTEGWFEFLRQERRDAGGPKVRPDSPVVGKAQVGEPAGGAAPPEGGDGGRPQG